MRYDEALSKHTDILEGHEKRLEQLESIEKHENALVFCVLVALLISALLSGLLFLIL